MSAVEVRLVWCRLNLTPVLRGFNAYFSAQHLAGRHYISFTTSLSKLFWYLSFLEYLYFFEIEFNPLLVPDWRCGHMHQAFLVSRKSSADSKHNREPFFLSSVASIQGGSTLCFVSSWYLLSILTAWDLIIPSDNMTNPSWIYLYTLPTSRP